LERVVAPGLRLREGEYALGDILQIAAGDTAADAAKMQMLDSNNAVKLQILIARDMDPVLMDEVYPAMVRAAMQK